jgi:hypothetical protein
MPELTSPGRTRGVVAAVTLAVVAATGSLAVTGLAQSVDTARLEARTATPLAAEAALGAAFWDAYFGDSGVADPANGIYQPAETHIEVEVKAAHDGEQIFIQYAFPTPLPSYYHDVVVFRDGAWVRAGGSPDGPEPHGVYEDRLTMLVDDGSVKGFANQGGWITCHEDLRDPFMFASAANADVAAHPVVGQIYGQADQRKYIPQSRDTGPEWWQFGGWDAVTEENLDLYAERQANGVFLDLWHWRAHRSEPIGFSDNQYVFETRRSSPGTSMYATNWSSDTAAPLFMFDPDVAGYHALTWDDLQAQAYGFDDQFFLAEGVNAIPYDPDHEWQEGDLMPRIYLRTPAGSRGIIESTAMLTQQDDGTWLWTVELRRPLDTGYEQADKAMKPGRTYNVAVAVHRLATGSRWHMVTLPFTIGIDTPGDVTAQRFSGDAPDWTAIDGSTRIAIYPGQTSWQWVTSDDHPGGVQVRNDSMSVIGCHDEVGLGAANKEMETYLAGLTPFGVRELTVARPGFDPGNIVFWFVVLAILILAAAVGIGWLRRG